MKELIQIQSKLRAPKGQYNGFGKYKYRSCEDILEAVKPILLAYECYLTISDAVELIGDRFYIKATATITNKEKESVSVSAYAREDITKKGMDLAQVTGATSSYARKYALNGLLAIDDTKDADSINTHDKLDYNELEKLISFTATDRNKLLAHYAIKDIKDISESDYNSALKMLKSKIKE